MPKISRHKEGWGSSFRDIFTVDMGSPTGDLDTMIAEWTSLVEQVLGARLMAFQRHSVAVLPNMATRTVELQITFLGDREMSLVDAAQFKRLLGDVIAMYQEEKDA
jgi:hypothetical protein